MKVFYLRRAMRAALLLLLLTVGVTKVFAQDPVIFEQGWLEYEVNGSNTVALRGVTEAMPDGTSFSVPSSVTYSSTTYTVNAIGNNAFEFCTKLNSIALPSTVTSIGASAFQGCTNLISVLIYGQISNIGNSAFSGCSSLPSFDFSAITATQLNNNCFANCTSLTEAVLPEGMQYVQYEAFYGCTNLRKLVFPSTVTQIHARVIQGCSNLEKLYFFRTTLPGAISEQSLYNPGVNFMIYVPAGCIETYTASPYFPSDPDRYAIIPAADFLTYAYDEDNHTATVTGHLPNIAGDLEIPSSIYHQGSTYSVTAIDGNAFINCSPLTSVTIPDAVTIIESRTFEQCTGLTSVNLPNNLAIINSSAFKNCSALTSIDIPQGVTIIGSNAFYATGLTTLTLPVFVAYIDYNAFRDCYSLESVYVLRTTPPSLGNNVFDGLQSDATLYVPYGSTDAYSEWSTWFTSIEELPADIQYDYDEVNHTATVLGYGGAFSGSLEIPATVEHNNETYTVTAIGQNAFKNYYTLTNVTLPNTITTIGNDAFRGCRNATINIPESLTTLGEGAFADCDNLTSVTLPEGLTSIPALAFYSCSALTEVHLPSTLTSIGIRAFGICTNLEIIFSAATTPPTCQVGNGNDTFLSVPSGCIVQVPYGYYDAYHTAPGWSSLFVNQGGFLYMMNEGNTEAIITGVQDNTFGDLVIPEMMNNRPTTTIVANAFQNKSGITSITLSSSMATIGAQAFAGCSDLKAINVNANNSNYTSVNGVLLSKDGKTLVAYPAGKTDANYNIPAGVENITSNAFEGAIVTSVNLPASISNTTNFRNAFYGANHIETMTVDANHTLVKAVNGVLFSNDGTNLIYYPRGKAGQYNVPSGVTYIQNFAFSECAQLSGITLNDELVSIEMYAFSKCTGLNTITLPEGITTINFATFMDCTNLKTVNFLGNISNIGSQSFRNTGLISLTLPATVNDIGSYAFAQCTSLAEVTCEVLYLFIPTGENIFYGVDTYDIPFYVVASQVGNYASNQPWASFSVRPMPTPNGYLLYTWSDVSYTVHVAGVSDQQAISGDLVIPGTVKRNNGRTYTVIAIDDEAFKNCTNLTSVVIPHTVETIGASAFESCTGLESVVIGRNVKTIGSYAFKYCDELVNIDWYPVNCGSLNVTTWYDALAYNKNLTIHNSVKSIPNYAFYHLVGLNSVTIPNSTESIGEYAFAADTQLTSFTMGSNVKTIGSYAFWSSGLTSIDLLNVETVGEGIFRECEALQTVTLRNSLSKLEDKMFYGCTSLYNVSIPSGVRTIGKEAFKGCTSLTTLTTAGYGGNLTTIGESAFEGCAMTSVDIPSTVTNINDYAFKECTALKSITLGTGLTTMGSYVFQFCQALENIDYYPTNCIFVNSSTWSSAGRTSTTVLKIKEGVQTLPVNAFSNLKLKQVAFPGTLQTIGVRAFYSSGLTSVSIPNSVTTIGDDAFYLCNLSAITLGSSLADIGEYAFAGSNSIATITSYNTTPPAVTANAFSNYNATLKVLAPATTDYSNHAVWSLFTIESLDGYYFTGATNSNWGTATNWSTGEVPVSDPIMEYIGGEWNQNYNADYTPNVVILADATVNIPNAFANQLTILDGNVVTVTNGSKLYIGNYGATYSATDASALVIEEGGQLWNNVDVEATVKKDIAHYTGNRNGYYFVASPIGEFYGDEADWVDPMDIEGMIASTPRNYDLYRFDQMALDAEWQNYKANPFGLRNGWGYLYAKANDVTLQFAGTVKSNEYESQLELVYTDEYIEVPIDPENPEAGYTYENYPYAGWNLMGNPFACDAYLSPMSTGFENLNFYKMNDNGSGVEAVENVSGTSIPACSGIFVKTPDLGTSSLTFIRELDPMMMYANQGNLQITLEQATLRGASEKIDNAIVSFNEGSRLEKFVLFQDNARIYIPQNGKDYAIVNTGPCGEMPLNFNAPKAGRYTLSVRPEEVQMSYLHLIDNLTGADTDLLETSSYSFDSKTTDYASRFKLVFICGDVNDDNESFAFFSNGSLIIANEGQATLQVIDVTGRILRSERISGSTNINLSESAGVYVLRLVNGENVKTQKIIIK